MESVEPDYSGAELSRHQLLWPDFDAIARGDAGADPLRRLRAAERSRRLLLIRSLVEVATKSEDLYRPLPSPETAWELLARVERAAPQALEAILAHPYTGTWVGYTTRLYRQDVTGVCPFWVHAGHVHCLAAAAAVRAKIHFETELPVWRGKVALPTLGMAHLPAEAPFTVAEIRGGPGGVEIRARNSRVRLPARPSTDAPGWLGLREAVSWSGDQRLAVRLDDLDPYRGLYEPIAPERLNPTELESWRTVLDKAWQLLTERMPELAEALPVGLDSLVPAPAVPFRQPSASTGEAFGSAIVAYGDDPATLAAALVHEFQHIRLGGLLHLVQLSRDDRRERLYAPWRDDPRPLGGVLHGIYAFFGVTAFWRACAAADPADELAAFEFALWRGQVWRTLAAVRVDESLTAAGRRFLECVAAKLQPWQDETVASGPSTWARFAAQDHYAVWRIRHLRPDPGTVAELTAAWRAGLSRPRLFGVGMPEPRVPTPVPDGEWQDSRTDLIRLRLGPDGAARAFAHGSSVPGATEADLHFVAGRPLEAAAGYRRTLAADPDDPAALAGLGLALSAHSTGPAARALLHRPELVRAVHRRLLLDEPEPTPSVEAIAGWLGRFTH
ncbi:HEXXH motif domain-containing protein [Amycolatopsis sp. NBRC 101858]|uniref:HEXXH motif domain-containing protein n=1 Tax=Amycolatopsis sp. NBRC 101858 TaxID=3032200 RepID=UPI0024A2B357|nr:HEXXH motif domain-containing protein [Amycolatopsis sp. NBRC 101858]GLY34810.1 HEXXH motif domain-containing protein [Amycolatopsis sp. NBRC 101858]